MKYERMFSSGRRSFFVWKEGVILLWNQNHRIAAADAADQICRGRGEEPAFLFRDVGLPCIL